jgi:cytochrome P450
MTSATGLQPITEAELPLLELNDAEFWQDIHTPLAAAREQAPALRTTEGAIYFLRHADIEEMLRDTRFEASDLLGMQGLTSGPVWEWWMRVMFSQNPPDHTRLRKLVSRVFTPRRVDAFRTQVRTQVETLFRPGFDSGSLEVIADVSHTLASDVVAAFIGIPQSDWGVFKQWTTDIGLAFGAAGDLDIRRRVEAALTNLDEYVADLLARRRADPGDDLLSALLAVEDQGDSLSRRELIDLVENLMFAGHDTTRCGIGVALKILAENPKSFRAIHENPGLIDQAVEELLRYENVIFTTVRQAREDLEIGGFSVAAGTPLAVCPPSASRDPRHYDSPDRVDVRRSEKSIVFGVGPHFCLGAPLARMELQEVVRCVTTRASGIELTEAVEWMPFAHIRRLLRVPLAFEFS